jgi:DNA-binding CsgD family transcriptional regulator
VPRSRHASAEDALVERARAPYLAANYGEAVETLAKASSAEAVLLKARALYRSKRYSEAARALAAVHDGTAGERAVTTALRGAAVRALGDPELGRSLLDEAVNEARRTGADADARAEVAYYAAVAAWESRDLARAEALIADGQRCDDHVLAAMLMQVSGWIDVRRERYRDAAVHFFKALKRLTKAQEREDLRFRAKILHALAIIASETIDLDLWNSVRPFYERTKWSEGVRREQFLTVTCVRFIALLEGDLEKAWRLSHEALLLAPSRSLRAIAETNAAAVARIAGDSFTAKLQFAAAAELIDPDVSVWRVADDEERVALPNFAIEAADVMKAEAGRCLTLYQSLRGKTDPGLALTGDRRVVAFAEMARGRVFEAMGRRGDAVTSYERSLRLWASLDYRMRAALVAQSLHRLTGDAADLDEQRVALARAPRAWFHDRAAARIAHIPQLDVLTRAERKVLRELLTGKSSREIAQVLDRSPFTVNNHTRRLFDVFGVRSRAALIARAAERGLGPEHVA